MSQLEESMTVPGRRTGCAYDMPPGSAAVCTVHPRRARAVRLQRLVPAVPAQSTGWHIWGRISRPRTCTPHAFDHDRVCSASIIDFCSGLALLQPSRQSLRRSFLFISHAPSSVFPPLPSHGLFSLFSGFRLAPRRVELREIRLSSRKPPLFPF